MTSRIRRCGRQGGRVGARDGAAGPDARGGRAPGRGHLLLAHRRLPGVRRALAGRAGAAGADGGRGCAPHRVPAVSASRQSLQGRRTCIAEWRKAEGVHVYSSIVVCVISQGSWCPNAMRRMVSVCSHACVRQCLCALTRPRLHNISPAELCMCTRGRRAAERADVHGRHHRPGARRAGGAGNADVSPHGDGGCARGPAGVQRHHDRACARRPLVRVPPTLPFFEVEKRGGQH